MRSSFSSGLGVACLALAAAPVVLAQSSGKGFRIELEQDGKAVAIADHQATLRPAPFDLIVYLPDKGGVKLRAAYTPALLDKAKSGAALGKVFSPGRCGADQLSNTDKKLWADEAGSDQHCWYYSSASPQHPFNEVKAASGQFKCRRSIVSLGLKAPSPVAAVASKHKALYLVFLSGKASEDFEETLEEQRDYLTVNFR